MSDQEKVSSNDISSNPEHEAEMIDPDAGATEEERKQIVCIN